MPTVRDPWFGRRIDIHTHLHDPLDLPSREVAERALLLARHQGVQRLVMLKTLEASHGSGDPTPELINLINSYTLELVRRYPNEYTGFCYLNPSNPPSFTQGEIERCIVKGGMRGVKLAFTLKATDTRLDPIMVRAGTLGIPVLHQCWYKATSYAYNESNPAELADLGRRFPQTTIIMAHLGGGRERGILDVADLPNVLIDTSGSQPEAGLVEYAVAKLGAHRVLYGSDYPVRDFGTQVGRVLGARIGDEAKDLIFYGNAVRILGL